MSAVLIVEDEPNLGVTLNEYLVGLGYRCQLATTVKAARELFVNIKPTVVLMDIGLPDGNGLELAREFRASRKDFVLLFLSALNDPEVRVEGLEIGAADYITKPFALKELTLRLQRILEINDQSAKLPEVIKHGDLEIHFTRYELVSRDKEIIPMAQKECAILKLLYERNGNVVTREEIIETVWGADKFPSERTVDNYIVKLRKWCESDQHQAISIQSVRGVGYKLSIANGDK